eukprot:SAG11_NODE_966_length_6356_cov_29.635608_3_plen_86_part_00
MNDRDCDITCRDSRRFSCHSETLAKFSEIASELVTLASDLIASELVTLEVTRGECFSPHVCPILIGLGVYAMFGLGELIGCRWVD